MVVDVATMYMRAVMITLSIHECDMRNIATDTQLSTKPAQNPLREFWHSFFEIRFVMRCVDLLQRITGSLPTPVGIVGDLRMHTVFVTRLLIGIVCEVTLHERLFDVVRSTDVLTHVSIGQ